MSGLVFVTGGARSGKSAFAEHRALVCAETTPGNGLAEVSYIATGEPLDEEFAGRINFHRASRDLRFITIEENLYLVHAIRQSLDARPVAVLECVTTWLGNVFHRVPEIERESFARDQAKAVLDALSVRPHATLFVVTNEIGMGVVPADQQTRQFQDVHGRINRLFAEAAAEAWMLISGLPLRLK